MRSTGKPNMKNRNIKKWCWVNKGMSVLEVLIAIAVITLSISASIMLVFSNQSITLDTDSASEALYKAKTQLEEARAKAQENFIGLKNNSSTTENIYTKQLSVTDLTPCLKRAMSKVSWATEVLRPQTLELTTDVAGIKEAMKIGDGCSDVTLEDWLNPQTYDSQDLIPGGNSGTDVDVIKINGRKYAFVTSFINNDAKDDFWVFDLEVYPTPIISKLNTGYGLNALDIVRDPNTNKFYAYVAHASSSAQLQVIDVTDPYKPILKKEVSLPGVGGSYPEGREVFYYDNHVYVGTRETAGNEFHIFDVTVRDNPVWRGSREINHSVNKISVSGNNAYLATTGNQNELVVLDISDPALITPSFPGVGNPEPWRFDAAGDADGTAVFSIGNKVYLGRERSTSNPDIYILDVSTPSNPSVINSKNLNLNPSTASVIDIVVNNNFMFLGTSDSNREFQVWKLTNLSNVWSYFNFPQAAVGLDFLDEKIYAAVKSNDALHIIYDQN